jgi:hypothetical protein
MDIGELVRLSANLIGERAPHRSMNHTQITRMLNMESLKLLRKKIGLPEEYQPGMPLPREATEISRKNKEDIRVFLKDLGIKPGGNPSLHISPKGIATIPTDLYYMSTIEYWKRVGSYVEFDTKPVEILTDVEFLDRQQSHIMAPSIDYPICNFQKDYIRFLPQNLGYAHCIYYRYPVDCIYAIKYINQDKPVYDPDNSRDLEWNDDNCLTIVMMFLGDLGIPLEKPDLIQYAELHKKEGV